MIGITYNNFKDFFSHKDVKDALSERLEKLADINNNYEELFTSLARKKYKKNIVDFQNIMIEEIYGHYKKQITTNGVDLFYTYYKGTVNDNGSYLYENEFIIKNIIGNVYTPIIPIGVNLNCEYFLCICYDSQKDKNDVSINTLLANKYNRYQQKIIVISIMNENKIEKCMCLKYYDNLNR